MPYLSYISDAKLEAIVHSVIDRGATALEQATGKAFEKNVIDPFAMLFEMASFGIDAEQWARDEARRQAQKTLTNHIGTLHQKILGSIDGWEDLGTGSAAGCDVVNRDRSLIAELKNKHNTVKKSDEIKLYEGLERLVMPKAGAFKGYTAYYVVIIPQKPQRYDREFTPPDSATGTVAQGNALIRSIDGASFYALATGERDALKNLFLALPKVIQAVSSDRQMTDADSAWRYFAKAFGA